MNVKNRGLGRGLSALIDNKEDTQRNVSGSTLYIGTDKISPSPYQPRKNFDKQKIEELSDSIRANGLIQPLVVRPTSEGYELITGERRWRACTKAGLSRIPVIVRDIDNSTAMALAMIENLQREDLNPMEKALGMDRLRSEANLGQENIAKELGISRAQVANTLRLLKLPQQIQNMLADAKITSGHARTLLALDEHGEMIQAAQQIIQKNLNVRQTEKMVQNWGKKTSKKVVTDKDLQEKVQGKITHRLGKKIKINFSGNASRGKITLQYKNAQDLDKIISLMETE